MKDADCRIYEVFVFLLAIMLMFFLFSFFLFFLFFLKEDVVLLIL